MIILPAKISSFGGHHTKKFGQIWRLTGNYISISPIFARIHIITPIFSIFALFATKFATCALSIWLSNQKICLDFVLAREYNRRGGSMHKIDRYITTGGSAPDCNWNLVSYHHIGQNSEINHQHKFVWIVQFLHCFRTYIINPTTAKRSAWAVKTRLHFAPVTKKLLLYYSRGHAIQLHRYSTTRRRWFKKSGAYALN